MEISFSSVHFIPSLKATAIFHSDSAAIFREDGDIPERILDKHTSYIPWGVDDQLPFNVLNKIEEDETLTTCQQFNAEVCYGAGLTYNTENATQAVKDEVEDFDLNNCLPSYYLGVCQDLKHFGFCVSVLYLAQDGKRIVGIARKEACYCRFTKADKNGQIREVLYANWRRLIEPEQVEHIELLNTLSPWYDLQTRMATDTKCRKFAIVTRIPTPDSTYYPIPYYAALFPNITLSKLMGNTQNHFDNYRALRMSLLGIEQTLAEKYISLELYAKFREMVINNSATEAASPIIAVLQQVELSLLTGDALPYEKVISLVNTIRNNATAFPEWQTSATAELFRLPQFENEKKSTGYWW